MTDHAAELHAERSLDELLDEALSPRDILDDELARDTLAEALRQLPVASHRHGLELRNASLDIAESLASLSLSSSRLTRRLADPADSTPPPPEDPRLARADDASAPSDRVRALRCIASRLRWSADPPGEVEAQKLLAEHAAFWSALRTEAERFWWTHSASVLLVSVGRSGAALEHAARAIEHAQNAGRPWALHGAYAQSCLVFLSEGELGGALAMACHSLGAIDDPSRSPPVFFNLLLCHLLRDEPQRVLDLARDNPWILERSLIRAHPAFRLLVACAHAWVGHVKLAREVVDKEPSWDGEEVPSLALLGVWMRAEVLLCAGEPAGAVRLAEAGLGRAQARGWSVSAMIGAKLHGLLARAWQIQARGDLSMGALQRAHACSVDWTEDSVVMALRAAYLAPDSGRPDQLSRRIGAVRRQAEAARSALRDAVNAPPPVARTELSTVRSHVTMIAHDLRGPLGGLIGLTDLLSRTGLDDRQRHYVRLAHDSGQALMGLCDRLLDLARADAGRLRLHPEPVAPRVLIDDVRRLFEPRFTLSGVALEVIVVDPMPSAIVADGARLRQVLLNLVANAARFTRHGRVKVIGHWVDPPDPAAADGMFRVTVDDTGPGFDPAQKERLFGAFEQGEDGADAPDAGVGLGLALCARLMALMGGSLDATTIPGSGSRFWFELPCRASSNRQDLHGPSPGRGA
jgi:signal transduction histidine kinase